MKLLVRILGSFCNTLIQEEFHFKERRGERAIGRRKKERPKDEVEGGEIEKGREEVEGRKEEKNRKISSLNCGRSPYSAPNLEFFFFLIRKLSMVY